MPTKEQLAEQWKAIKAAEGAEPKSAEGSGA